MRMRFNGNGTIRRSQAFSSEIGNRVLCWKVCRSQDHCWRPTPHKGRWTAIELELETRGNKLSHHRIMSAHNQEDRLIFEEILHVLFNNTSTPSSVTRKCSCSSCVTSSSAAVTTLKNPNSYGAHKYESGAISSSMCASFHCE